MSYAEGAGPAVKLDPQDLKLGAEAAKAGLLAAQTQYEQAEADARRYRDLRAQGFIGAAEMERRETAVKAAKAQWDQARAQASAQGNQAQYASLVADRSGVVTSVDAEPGQVLSAGMPVLRVAYDGPRDAVFAVPEQQVQVLKALQGQVGALSVQLWGDGTSYPATLRELAAAADPQTRTFLAKADVGAMPTKLGQTATVTLARPVKGPALRLPLTALAEAKGKSVVWVLDSPSMTVRQQAVVVATADGNEVILASGLKAGEVVVTAGAHVLTPGQKVRLYKEPVAPSGPAASR
ncbi:MAG: efflux RND transporter periplasmic adaptor subunit [Ideonella sp. MAG2]|nr:MAG: efflux RND transporter periplasmic adaptor subunit [Ideonella sp. MAG2]